MWISPDCHGIVAVLVISGKQPSSGLLHTLRFICVCVWPLSAVCYNIASSSSHRGSTLVFPGTRSHVSPHRLTSTTQPLCHCARVYHNIHNTLPLSLGLLRFVFFVGKLCTATRLPGSIIGEKGGGGDLGAGTTQCEPTVGVRATPYHDNGRRHMLYPVYLTLGSHASRSCDITIFYRCTVDRLLVCTR